MELSQFQLQSQYEKLICNFQKQQLNLILINFKEQQFYFQKTITKQNYETQSNQLYKIFKTPHQLFEQLKKAFYFNLLSIQYNEICIQSKDNKKQQIKCLPLKKVPTTLLQRYSINKMNKNMNKKHKKNEIKKDLKEQIEQMKKQQFEKQKINLDSLNVDIEQQIRMNNHFNQKQVKQNRLLEKHQIQDTIKSINSIDSTKPITYIPQKSKAHLSQKQKKDVSSKSRTYIQQKSTTLFIGNLSFNASLQTMKEFFSNAGKVKQVRIIHDKITGSCKGYGFVDYFDIETTKRAYQLLNGKNFEGRKIRIDWSNNKDS